MKIILSNSEKVPFYEQLENQLSHKILEGELKPDEKLPSIRNFAKDLGISVITIKRAYDDLESEGYIHTVSGKGSFVAGQSIARLKENKLQLLEDQLHQTLYELQQHGVTKEALITTISLLWEEGD